MNFLQTRQFSAGSEAESGLHVCCFCGSDTSDLSCVPGGVLGSNGLSLVGLLSSFLPLPIMLPATGARCYHTRAKAAYPEFPNKN